MLPNPAAPGAAAAGSSGGGNESIAALSASLSSINAATRSACRACDGLSRRSRHLDSLTSPASETSALLQRTSANLVSTGAVLRDALERFSAVGDCEPAVERLYFGAREAAREVSVHAERQGRGGVLPASMRRLLDGSHEAPKLKLRSVGSGVAQGTDGQGGAGQGANAPLTEQELYAGADAMEIVRDAHAYFGRRAEWKSTEETMEDLNRVHHVGVDAMALLVTGHLTGAGAAVRRKVEGAAATPDRKGGKTRRGGTAADRAEESAGTTRDRLQEALTNRDLMKSIGEYEEYLPLSTRVVRELRAIFECLAGMPTDGRGLILSSDGGAGVTDFAVRPSVPPGGKVLRTEKVGSGHYTNVATAALRTGHPHLDAYGEARRAVAYASVDGYCRQLRNARRKRAGTGGGGSASDRARDVDSAARDAVRIIEHTMVVVSGEKAVYRCVAAPSMKVDHGDGGRGNGKAAETYERALGASYSYVVSAAVDRLLDLVEYTFLREAGCAPTSQDGGTASDLDIRAAASAAAAGLRIVDGVRMLGPSLSKLCELDSSTGGGSSSSQTDGAPAASALCISLHRSTVKNCAKTLENLARSIQLDRGSETADGRVAAVSSDVVHAVRVVSPFHSAYKSVSKRRALPWDQGIGNDAGEMDVFVRFLIKQLLISLQGKAQNYRAEGEGGGGQDALAKSHLFMMNNTYYLLDLLAADSFVGSTGGVEGADFRITGSWFRDKMTKTFDAEKARYLKYWDRLNSHLTDVDDGQLSYQNNKDVLSLESGRLLKSRFSGFIEDFERVYTVHRNFTVIDPRLRVMLQDDIRGVFLTRYAGFFQKYSRINFSKKNMESYLKYTPQKIDSLLGQLFLMQ